MGYRNMCLLLIFFFISSSLQDWTGPQIVHVFDSRIKKCQVHINTDTGVAHIFGVSLNEIVHASYRGQFIGQPKVISETLGLSFTMATHSQHQAAEEDGEDKQIIMFLFQGTRSGKGSKTCTEDNQEGCNEIYYLYTFDEGQTWSKPAIISHPDPNDVASRTRPAIVYDKVTHKFYLVYAYKNMKTGESKIALRSKGVDNNPFTDEEFIDLGDIKIHCCPKLSLTNPHQKEAFLHLALTVEINDKDQGVYYYKSQDYGKTWQGLTDISIVDPTQMKQFDLTSQGIYGETQVSIVYSAYNMLYTSLITSNDNGRIWSMPKVIGKNAIFKSKACGLTKTLGILTSLHSKEDGFIMNYKNLTDDKFYNLPLPFNNVEGIKALPMIDCTGLEPGTEKFVVVGFSENKLYFDDWNFDYPPYDMEKE